MVPGLDIRVSVSGQSKSVGEDGCWVFVEESFVLVYEAELLQDGGAREG